LALLDIAVLQVLLFKEFFRAVFLADKNYAAVPPPPAQLAAKAAYN
jgi:hypothetical protein